MNFKKQLMLLTIISGISSLAIIISPTKAGAWATSADVANSTSNVNSVTKQESLKTQQAINTASNQIVAAIQELSRQNTTNTVGTTNAMANMKDVEDQRRVTMAIQKEKIAATNQATNGASNCNAITGAAATQNLENLTQLWRTSATHALLSRNQGFINGSNVPVTSSTLEQTYSQYHCKYNATQADIATGRCSSYNIKQPTQVATQASSGGSQIADVSDDQNADLFLNHDILSANQADAMGRFLSLATDSNAPGQAIIPNVNNSVDKEKVSYGLDSLRAMRSVPASIMSGLVGQTKIMTTSGGQTQKMATQWANATAGQIAGYDQNSSGTIFPDGISELAADGIKSKFWFYNINYQVYAAAEGQAAAAKDLNSMVAWNTVLNYKRYLQERNTNALLSIIASIMIDKKQKEILSGNF